MTTLDLISQVIWRIFFREFWPCVSTVHLVAKTGRVETLWRPRTKAPFCCHAKKKFSNKKRVPTTLLSGLFVNQDLQPKLAYLRKKLALFPHLRLYPNPLCQRYLQNVTTMTGTKSDQVLTKNPVQLHVMKLMRIPRVRTSWPWLRKTWPFLP